MNSEPPRRPTLWHQLKGCTPERYTWNDGDPYMTCRHCRKRLYFRDMPGVKVAGERPADS